jgi:hypothetical protein
MPTPFQTLSISPDSTRAQVLHAWRRLMLVHHPDKADPPDSPRAKELNAAKETCLEQITHTPVQQANEDEFVRHINTILQATMGLDHDLSRLIRPSLDRFMHVRAVDAMEWVLLCGMGEMPFQQSKHDEIPILRKYYNAFIGQDNWDDDDNTIMTVLNKYEEIAAKGFGNFAKPLADAHCI